MSEKIKIVIVDDHEIFLKGLESILLEQANFEILETFFGGRHLLNSLPLENVDVLLLDLQLPDISPEKLLREIRVIQPKLKVLYLTLVRGNRYFNKLSEYGFEGYILKDSPIEILVEAIKTVANGKTFYGDRYSQKDQINTVTLPENKAISVLSSREVEVLKLVAQELSSAQIAERLFVSVSTIDSHRQNIMIKLGVDNIVGLIKIAISNNLI
ncbi:DNA-binding response regulator [Lacihabitans sp. LS3-19]|uniref:response regulator n=1 Tax=Lacihabitans sp. LS3-19 TaxID=2487335 RepID=UPI0020CFBB47|nr:response regulator transcription factor [Lacihabitans sp. LS3-19]MCP9768337.1 DNA-binding response regulator [Lacihabitans sp. LS3-19]